MERPDPSVTHFFAKLQALIAELNVLNLDPKRELNLVCGVDAAYDRKRVVAAAVLYDRIKDEVVETKLYEGLGSFPYIPGLLYLREGPFLVRAIEDLAKEPDLILVDGHGLAHPRRAGLATIVGVVLEKPTIGVAKSLLVGRVEDASGPLNPILLGGSLVGYCVARKDSKRYYVSPGHMVGIKDLPPMLENLGGSYPRVLKEAHKVCNEGVRRHGEG